MIKFSSVKYLLKSGCRNVWHNRLMSLATLFILIVCLVLTGAASIISKNIDNILSSVESNNSIRVFLDKSVTAVDAVQIGQQIKQIENINECEFVSKEEAAQKIIDKLKSKSSSTELLAKSYAENNNLPNAFNISLIDLSKYDETINKVKDVPGIAVVNDISEVANKLTSFNRKISTVGVFLIITLGIVSLFIMIMTIRLTMFSRKLEINIMKSVGATDWFVRIPFIVEGVIIGILAAIFASGILKLIMIAVFSYLKKLVPFQTFEFVGVTWGLVFMFIFVGILFGVLGGIVSIRKYLRGKGGSIFDE